MRIAAIGRDGRSYGNSCRKAILGVQVSLCVSVLVFSFFALPMSSDHISHMPHASIYLSFDVDCTDSI